MGGSGVGFPHRTHIPKIPTAPAHNPTCHPPPQTELMKVVYLLAEEGGILDALISGYDWPVFMAPLGLPELEGQEWASRANFRLVKVWAALAGKWRHTPPSATHV